MYIYMSIACNSVLPSIQAIGEEGPVPSVFNFDVLGSHTAWQCVELLLTHLPLLKLLLSVLLGSYKKVGRC